MQTSDIPSSITPIRLRTGLPKVGVGAQTQRADAFSAILAAVPQLDAKADDAAMQTREEDEHLGRDQPSDAFESPTLVGVTAVAMNFAPPNQVGMSVNAPLTSSRTEELVSSEVSLLQKDAAVQGGEDARLESDHLEGYRSSDEPVTGTDHNFVSAAPANTQTRLNRSQPSLTNSVGRTSASLLHGRGLERDAFHHGAAESQARTDSTATLQNELARAQVIQVGITHVPNTFNAVRDRRTAERFGGEIGLGKMGDGIDPQASWLTSMTEGGSGSTAGTNALAGVGMGLIPGIAGRLADSLDEVSERLSESSQASRALETSSTVAGSPTGHRHLESASALGIEPRLGSPDWSGAFAQAVAQVAANELTEATLTVSPPELGTIEINLELDGDQMHIAFLSDNADVRKSVESGLPSLAQLLEKQGFSLGSTDVRGNERPFQGGAGDSGARSESAARSSGGSPPARRENNTAETLTSPARSAQPSPDGRVDVYA